MLRLILSTQPVSLFETQPQIMLHVRPLTLQLYWTTYKTHVLLTASHLFSNKHAWLFASIFFFSNSKRFAVQTRGDTEWNFRKRSHHEIASWTSRVWEMSPFCHDMFTTTSCFTQRRANKAWLYGLASLVGNTSVASWRCIFSLSPSLTSEQLEEKPSISIFFNEPPISQVPGCSIPVGSLTEVLHWSAHVKQSGDPSSCQPSAQEHPQIWGTASMRSHAYLEPFAAPSKRPMKPGTPELCTSIRI